MDVSLPIHVLLKTYFGQAIAYSISDLSAGTPDSAAAAGILNVPSSCPMLVFTTFSTMKTTSHSCWDRIYITINIFVFAWRAPGDEPARGHGRAERLRPMSKHCCSTAVS